MGTILQASPIPTETQREELMIGLFVVMQKARFNVIYYGARANRMRLYATTSNVVAALASSVALVGLLSDSAFGPLALRILTAVAAGMAAVGPILHWDGKASQFEKAALGHGIILNRVQVLLHDLKLADGATAEHHARVSELDAFHGALTALDEAGDERLKKKAWEQTEREFPVGDAWNLV
jgi:hypothetical protein